MVSNMKKTIEEFKKIYLNKDMDLFMKDPHLKADFYYYNHEYFNYYYEFVNEIRENIMSFLITNLWVF